LICTSNVTANTLTSGVAGYRYSINTRAVYHVTAGDNWYGTNSLNPYIGVTMSSSRQYLHIAAQDKAGNLSETVHIVISPEDVIFWPVMTDQIRIEEGENVYKHPGEENTYYVKADGTTPFTVSFTGRILGSANKNYQINQLQFLTRNTSGNESEGMMKLMVPMKNPVTAGSHTYQNTDVQKQYENEFCMEDASYTRIQRSDYCKKLQVTQTFKLGPPLHGSRISMVPGAGVMTSEIQVISDRETDRRNGIWLIPDGRGPEIVGLEIPEETLDPHAAKWSYCITVSATDQGSGLKNLWLEIHNTDNGGYEKIEDEDGDGRITLEITSEKSLFLGKYSVIAYARDCVGNETTAVFGLDGIAVDAVIEKIRDPQSKVFKKGESGILKVQAFGYVEKMEVLFPEEWMAADSSINRSFVYEAEEYLQQEEISFMVPLQASEGEVIITVKAYKDDQIVEVDPKLTTITIAGSVLEELRTRLR